MNDLTDITEVAHMGLPHDPAFKPFVQHPTFIRHLLQVFPMRFLEEGRIAGLRSVRSGRVGAMLARRRADAVWEARMLNGELVYLIVECQSYVDPAMPGRMLQFGGMVVLDLIEAPSPVHGYGKRRYPRVVGLVVYSGKGAWSAPLDAAEGMGVHEAADRRAVPTFEYRVVDLRRMMLPGGRGNVAVLLQRMQLCDSPEELREAAQPLRRLGEVEGIEKVERLARGYALWTTEVLLPVMGVDEVEVSGNLEEVLGLLEGWGMNWAERIEEKGLEKGRLIGLREILVIIAKGRIGESQAQSMSKLLEQVSDPQRLLEIGDRLDEGISGEALLARLGHG